MQIDRFNSPTTVDRRDETFNKMLILYPTHKYRALKRDMLLSTYSGAFNKKSETNFIRHSRALLFPFHVQQLYNKDNM